MRSPNRLSIDDHASPNTCANNDAHDAAAAPASQAAYSAEVRQRRTKAGSQPCFAGRSGLSRSENGLAQSESVAVVFDQNRKAEALLKLVAHRRSAPAWDV
jgi:hypothetical protein